MKYTKQDADLSQISEWVATAVDHRRIQHIDVELHDPLCFIGSLPANINNCKTLVSLKLQFVEPPENPEFVVSLPCLKIMYLENIYDYYPDICSSINFDNDYVEGPSFTEKLISSCPVLEELNMVRYYDGYLETMRVRSQTLKIFRLLFHPREDNTYYAVEIDAPRLKYMSFADSQSDRIVVRNLNSLLKIEIDTEFNVNGRDYSELEVFRQTDVIREFLIGICNVKHMIISHPTLQVLFRYSKLGSIPKFHNLSHLQAVFSSSSLPLLPVFLESCSNLKNLILDFSVSTEPEQKINLTNKPQCLISTLERVEINKLYQWEGTGINIAMYFLMNAVVLKKLNLNDSDKTNQEIDFYKSLFTLIKRSSKCQVFFDDMQLIMLGR